MTALMPSIEPRHEQSNGADLPCTSDLHHDVVHQWGWEIVSGAQPPGTRITAEDVAVQYGVSRTVVREALRVLESLGLLTVRRRVGITVLPPEHWNVFDLRVIRWRLAGPDRAQHNQWWHELRSTVEPLAARLAATNATPQQRGALADAVVGMSAAHQVADTVVYLVQIANFHQVLLSASGNQVLAGLADAVADVIIGDAKRGQVSDAANLEVIRLHGVVASAIENWDVTAADEAMRAICHRVGEPGI